MITSEIASYIANAAASGVIGNRMDAFVTSLEPVRKLHAWLRERRIEPVAMEPSPLIDSWLSMLSDTDRNQLGTLLRATVGLAQTRNVQSTNGVAIGGDAHAAVIGTQNNYLAPSANDNSWEYVKVTHGREADMKNLGTMMWAAYIAWPGADRLDVRDHARIEEILNELGEQGWQLISQQPAMGINTTEYILRRARPSK